MGFDPHGEVFYGYDLGQLTGPIPEGGHPWEAPSIAPAWMLEDPQDPTLGLGEGYGDWESELATRLAGWVDLPFPDEARKVPPPDRIGWSSSDTDREHPAYKAWSANLARKREIVAGAGCDLAPYGTHEGAAVDGLQLRVAVTASCVRSSYDCVPLDIGRAQRVGVLDEWNGLLHAFLDVLDIPRPAGGPGWHLTSDYG